jgi:hypothetical protein
MRRKTYYTANEITTYLYTNGEEWMLQNGTNYVGLYHTYTTGETYTEPVWDKNKSKKLVAYEDTTTSKYKYKQIADVEVKTKSFEIISPSITKQDLTNKFKTRYIVRKNNDATFSETNEAGFVLWEKQEVDNVVYTIYPIKWVISGNTQDIIENGVLIPSVQTQNTKTISDAESTIPGVSRYLTDPLELYVDTDIVIVVDINGLDS